MKIDRKFIGRLATYLIGVAIGLLLVGVIRMQKSRSGAGAPAPTSEAADAAPAAGQ